jgi:Ca2+-binding RTX toxin-like protein
MLLLMAMAAALVVVGGVAYAATFITCDTPEDQDPDAGQCRGTEEVDSINATESADEVRALAGDDFVDGLGGNDEIYGDKGIDGVEGNPGNDTIYGGPDGDGSANGTDFVTFVNLEGQEGSDTVYGGGGDDYIDAAANDVSTGAVDRSIGGRGNDLIKAVDGNKDIINCGKGKGDVVEFDGGGIDKRIRGCETKIEVAD